tara:strand:+ start:465 stop:716 length:252 start_codon:yes stop_codon:yes gene_type:complete
MDVPQLPNDILLKILHIKGQNEKQIAHDKHKQKFQSTIEYLTDNRMGWINRPKKWEGKVRRIFPHHRDGGKYKPFPEWVARIW